MIILAAGGIEFRDGTSLCFGSGILPPWVTAGDDHARCPLRGLLAPPRQLVNRLFF
jgi:hypothetical protein